MNKIGFIGTTAKIGDYAAQLYQMLRKEYGDFECIVIPTAPLGKIVQQCSKLYKLHCHYVSLIKPGQKSAYYKQFEDVAKLCNILVVVNSKGNKVIANAVDHANKSGKLVIWLNPELPLPNKISDLAEL